MRKICTLLSSLEIDSTSQIQILYESVYISLCANAFTKGSLETEFSPQLHVYNHKVIL